MERPRQKLKEALNDLVADLEDYKDLNVLEIVENIITGKKRPVFKIIVKDIDEFMDYFPVIDEKDRVIVKKEHLSDKKQRYIRITIELAPPQEP